MKKFLYFASGAGANLTEESYIGEADMISCIVPQTTTKTAIYFNKTDNTKDKIVLTHDNTTNNHGHRVLHIGKAVAEAANAGPHANGIVDVIDLDNNIFYGDLTFITGVEIQLNAGHDESNPLYE